MAYIFQRKDKETGKPISKIWYIGYKLNGVPKQVSSRMTSKQDAESLMKRKYEPLELNELHQISFKSVEQDLIESIDEYIKGGINLSLKRATTKAKNSISRDTSSMNSFRKWCIENDYTKFHEVPRERLEFYIDNYCFITKKLKKSTLQRELKTIKMFFNWSVKQGYTQKSPLQETKNISVSQKAPRFFTDEELKKVFDKADDKHRKIFQFLYLTGLRINELTNLKWSDYVESAKMLYVREQEGNKSKKQGEVIINSHAKAILDNLYIDKNDEYIFHNEGEQLIIKHIRYYVKKLYTDLKIKDIAMPLHIFRATCASHLAIKGESLYTIMRVLRHSSISQVLCYAGLTRDNLSNAMDQLTL